MFTLDKRSLFILISLLKNCEYKNSRLFPGLQQSFLYEIYQVSKLLLLKVSFENELLQIKRLLNKNRYFIASKIKYYTLIFLELHK